MRCGGRGGFRRGLKEDGFETGVFFAPAFPVEADAVVAFFACSLAAGGVVSTGDSSDELSGWESKRNPEVNR